MHGFLDPWVDEDHDRVITFFEALSAGPTDADPRLFSDLSAFLLLYLGRHCRREEALMRGRGYPGADDHARAHRDLQAEFRRILLPRLRDRADFAGDLALVRKLFLGHIVTWDEAYGAWLEVHLPGAA